MSTTMNQIITNLTTQKHWVRGLYMILFLLIWHIAEIVVIGITIGQFLFTVISGKNNENLMLFGGSVGRYVQQVLAFLSYNSEQKPFPFKAWPNK